MRIAILKTQANPTDLSPNIDLEITQSKIAPSIFSLRENISKSLIQSNQRGLLQARKINQW